MGIDHFWIIFNMGPYGDNMGFYGLKLVHMEVWMGWGGGGNKYRNSLL